MYYDDAKRETHLEVYVDGNKIDVFEEEQIGGEGLVDTQHLVKHLAKSLNMEYVEEDVHEEED